MAYKQNISFDSTPPERPWVARINHEKLKEMPREPMTMHLSGSPEVIEEILGFPVIINETLPNDVMVLESAHNRVVVHGISHQSPPDNAPDRE